MNHNLLIPSPHASSQMRRLLCAVVSSPFSFSLPPCSVQPPDRIDPFSPFVGQFVKVGQIGGGTYDGKIWAIGDCNGDSLTDWILHRVREDTLVNHFGSPKNPEELLLFRGRKGMIPSSAEAVRIGPKEVAIRAELVAWGDWDSNGALDLALNVAWRNDSSYGEYFRYFFHLIVYWGEELRGWSVEDTTHLSSGYSDLYAFVPSGIGDQDVSGDSIDDLIVYTGAAMGYTRGIGNVVIPRLQVFEGKVGKRWGHTGITRVPNWSWWLTPTVSRLGAKVVDQNCDNAPDVVLYHDDHGGGRVSILYGTSGGGLPDTANVETIDLSTPWPPAETSQLFDVTGDAVLDLVVLDDLNVTDSQRIRVYPGEPGQGIEALYGTGRNPWANFPTPIMLHDGWGGYLHRLYDLGDANRDGTRDIYVYHHPFFLSYTTGDRLDSLLDGYYRFDGVTPLSFVNLGRIDRSGWDVIAVTYRSGITFLRGSDSIAREGVFRQLPHPKTQRCFSTVSVVEEQNALPTGEGQPDLTATPIPMGDK